MKRVTILVPDDVSASDVSYWNGYRHVKVDVIDDGSCPKVRGLSNREVEEVCKRLREGMRKSSIAPYGLMVSRKEFDALCSRVQRLELLTTSYQPSAEEGLRIVGCSDKEIEEIRSRVEKLERESERQCARVIKMEEGISDDLK